MSVAPSRTGRLPLRLSATRLAADAPVLSPSTVSSGEDYAQGRADVGALTGSYYEKKNSWPRDGLRMIFISSHDRNAWDGTRFYAFGEALANAIALSFASDGNPLICNGQEAGSPKRLAFFEKDPTEWRDHPVGDLHARLFDL